MCCVGYEVLETETRPAMQQAVQISCSCSSTDSMSRADVPKSCWAVVRNNPQDGGAQEIELDEIGSWTVTGMLLLVISCARKSLNGLATFGLATALLAIPLHPLSLILISLTPSRGSSVPLSYMGSTPCRLFSCALSFIS
jgi:hypothetical protein